MKVPSLRANIKESRLCCRLAALCKFWESGQIVCPKLFLSESCKSAATRREDGQDGDILL
jgi:hypothetical protein